MQSIVSGNTLLEFQNDHVSALEDSDDSSIYFTPESGNVLFSSAVDGWAFRIRDFAQFYENKLNVPADKLEQVLWVNLRKYLKIKH